MCVDVGNSGCDIRSYKRFRQKFGQAGNCGKTVTDPTSVTQLEL